MLALVTGGTGFIGSHLCRRLRAEGHRVRVLARPGSDLAGLAGLELDLVRGDLDEAAGLEAACRGVDWLFHLAGALKGFQPQDLLRVNRDGTARLLAACPPGLSRFVLVSSLAAGGPSPGGALARGEDDPPQPLTWYGHSKLEAERLVRASGLPSVILRPSVVFGPRDRDVLGYFRCARSGWLPVPAGGDRRYGLVFAPDLADGLIRAARTPTPPGEVFHLSGPAVTWTEFGLRIAAALGRRGRVLPLPEPAVRAAGRVADAWARLRGRPEIFSSQKVLEMLAPGWVASLDKSRRILGWEAATPLEPALAATVAWYRTHGWLRHD
jgi:nucleoside-diphosphate-sugar epimerase